MGGGCCYKEDSGPGTYHPEDQKAGRIFGVTANWMWPEVSSVYLETCGQHLFARKSGSLPLLIPEATVAKGHKLEKGRSGQFEVRAEARDWHGG